MRWRQVIALYGVLGALGAEYYLIEQRRPGVPAGRPPRERMLPMGADEVDEIRLRRGGRALVLRRSQDGWAVVEPRGAQIHTDLVTAFARSLVGAEQIDRLDESGGDLAAYGLGEGAAEVEVVGRAEHRVVVTLGGTNPTGTAVYARRVGSPGIILIGRDVRDHEDMIFRALGASGPAIDGPLPVGG